MRTSVIVMALCLSALVAGGHAAWKNPCAPHTGTFPTTFDALQGIWKGSCSSLTSPVDASSSSSPYKCALDPMTYDYTVVYNGTSAGVNISGLVIPLGNALTLDSSPADIGSRLLLLNLTLFPGFSVNGLIHTTVSCNKGVPTYREIAIHSLAAPTNPTTFPFPMKRDTTLWCNKRTFEYQAHGAGTFNLICTCTRVGDAPAQWP